MRGPADRNAVQKNAAKLDAAANAVASVSVSAIADEYWVLDEIHYSYDGTPTANRSLTVGYADPGDPSLISWRVDVTASGPGEIRFPRGFYEGTVNRVLSVQLSDGGVGVTGKVSIVYR